MEEWKEHDSTFELYKNTLEKIKGTLCSLQITSEREQEIGPNLEPERLISNIRKMFVMERMAGTG